MSLTIDSTARQRSIRLPNDIEKANGHSHHDHLHPPEPESGVSQSLRSPGTESQRRRRDMLAETLHIEEGKEELIRFWDQFMRKDKKKIGVVESLRAFLFSSCEFTVALYAPTSLSGYQ